MTKVYIVEFETGEYEDCHEVIHLATFSKDRAEKECERMNQILLDSNMHCTSSNRGGVRTMPETSYHVDYTGGEFYVYDIEVED